MALNNPFFSSNWTVLIFCAILVIILFILGLSFDKIIGICAFLGIALIMYNMITNSTSMLVVGLAGIIVVLLFSLASGTGRQQPIVIHKSCDSNNNNISNLKPLKRTSSCPITNTSPAGLCPVGYTNFTDEEGNTLCCGSSNVDNYSHTCPAVGPLGICSMTPGITDPRSNGISYPVCQNLRQEQSKQNSKLRCPDKYPHYLQMPNSPNNYKCCGMPSGSNSTNCPNPELSCSSMFGSQNIFNTPKSCEAIRFVSTLTCPTGTTFNPTNIVTDIKTKNTKTVPSCNGATNICYPKAVLQKCMSLGYCSNINIDTTLSNCEVYDKVFNVKNMNIANADLKGADFFN